MATVHAALQSYIDTPTEEAWNALVLRDDLGAFDTLPTTPTQKFLILGFHSLRETIAG
jgi:hypothetical protein